MTSLINEVLKVSDDISSRKQNSLSMDVETICESVICTTEYVVSSLSSGLPKSVYQLALFNQLSKNGFRLKIHEVEHGDCVESGWKKEIIIVNDVLAIECVVQDELITDSQRRLMLDQDNNSVAGIFVNFSDFHNEHPITRVYQNSVLH